jgi:putative transposase
MTDYTDLVSRGKRQGFLRARRKSSYPGLISHITQRAAGKEPLFVEDADYLYMLKIIKDIAGEYDLTVYSFCLMTNHLHLLFRQNQDNLSPAMQSLFARYAIYFNNKYHRKGHLFCGAYRQSACYGKYYFLAASIYIHLNPERAGIVAQASQYRWSTWNLYCGEKAPDTFVEWVYAMKLLDEEIHSAKIKYRRLVDQARAYRSGEVLEDKQAIGRFGIWMRKQFPGLMEETPYLQGLMPDGYISDKELDRLLLRLKGKKRLTQPMDLQARRFSIEQLQARGYSIQEIMDCLGITRPTLYNALTH